MDAPLAPQRRDADRAEIVQPEDDQEDAAQLQEQLAVPEERAVQDARGQPEEDHEDEREAEHEGGRVAQQCPARRAARHAAHRQFVAAHAGQVPEEERHQRQRAGGEEGEQPGDEGGRDVHPFKHGGSASNKSPRGATNHSGNYTPTASRTPLGCIR